MQNFTVPNHQIMTSMTLRYVKHPKKPFLTKFRFLNHTPPYYVPHGSILRFCENRIFCSKITFLEENPPKSNFVDAKFFSWKWSKYSIHRIYKYLRHPKNPFLKKFWFFSRLPSFYMPHSTILRFYRNCIFCSKSRF